MKEAVFTVTGIIAEFNPLHTGHKYIIDKAHETADTVICVISGNFVQRGDTAIIPKLKRAQSALLCGADLVAELPVLWSMSTAQNFALGGVSQLYHLGCDEILFGSECGDIKALEHAVDILESDEFGIRVAAEIGKGVTFAAARQSAAVAMGVDAALFENPNDNLGIEYIMAARSLRLPIKFRCVKREGARHDEITTDKGFVSASLLRQRLQKGEIGFAERYMPTCLRGLISPDIISNANRLETAILATLRTKTAKDFVSLPDISEGLENKLEFSVKNATSLDELCNMLKTKRYTMARIRRLVLSAFLGFDGKYFMTPPPYVRVLGFNKTGEEHLRSLKASLIPVVTRIAQIKELDEYCQNVFTTECKASDIYALSLSKAQECGSEYKSKLLKI